MAYIREMRCTKRTGTATFNASPLCSMKDPGSRLLESCRHHDIFKSYIERHNCADMLFFRAIMEGTKDKCSNRDRGQSTAWSQST